MSKINANQIGIINDGNSQNYGTQVGIQHNSATPEEKSLAEVAQEIQDLLDQLAQSYPTETATQKAILGAKTVERIEENPTLKVRVVSALKSCGMAALQEAVDNPLFNVVSSLLEGFIDP